MVANMLQGSLRYEHQISMLSRRHNVQERDGICAKGLGR